MVEYKSFLLFIQQKSQMYCNITVNYPNWYENVVENSQKMWYN